MLTIDGEVGPTECDGGPNPWTFQPVGRITGIGIASGVVIDSIKFTYEDHSHMKHHSPTYGGDGGTYLKIDFDGDEAVIRVSGTTGEYEDTVVITSLSFYTNKGKTYGPYGTDKGNSFSYTWSLPESMLIGFNGSYGDYLTFFGVIIQTQQ